MSVHRYTSRGRTKQPKSLTKKHVDPNRVPAVPAVHFRASGSVTIVDAASSLSGNLDSTLDGFNGYSTENQKYLHLCLQTTGAMGSIVDVYAYNNQFGKWGELRIPIKQNASNFDGALLPLALSGSPSSTFYVTVPIEGIDRVAFVGTNADRVVLHVAGSTI